MVKIIEQLSKLGGKINNNNNNVSTDNTLQYASNNIHVMILIYKIIIELCLDKKLEN